MGELRSGMRLAVGTLTVIPVGRVGEITPRRARVAMTLAPVAVLPIAAAAGAVLAVTGWLGMPGQLGAALCLTVVALGTRAMHLDGLADTMDGFGGGWDRERALDVMRRGDVGPMGAAALTLTLLGQAAAVSAVAGRPHGWLLVATAIAASRGTCAITSAAGVPPARRDGMGAVMAGSVPRWLTGLVVLALTMALSGAAVTSDIAWWQGAMAVVAAALAVVALVRRAVRVFRGVTGDVMGAGIEVALVVLLGVLSAGGVG